LAFGGDYGKVKDTGSFVSAVKNTVAAMVSVIPEITIKDEENEFDARVGNEEYKKFHKDVAEYTTRIINALNELPVYYLLHIISVRPSKQPLMVRTFLKVYMELGSSFSFLQEQIKDIIIIVIISKKD
jgi:hypothetical protein